MPRTHPTSSYGGCSRSSGADPKGLCRMVLGPLLEPVRVVRVETTPQEASCGSSLLVSRSFSAQPPCLHRSRVAGRSRRGRFTPYVTMGVFGRQTWTGGSMFVHDTTSLSWDIPSFRSSRGDIMGTLGLGLRGRLGSRSFQLELRRIYSSNGLTFGTRIPF